MRRYKYRQKQLFFRYASKSEIKTRMVDGEIYSGDASHREFDEDKIIQIIPEIKKRCSGKIPEQRLQVYQQMAYCNFQPQSTNSFSNFLP